MKKVYYSRNSHKSKSTRSVNSSSSSITRPDSPPKVSVIHETPPPPPPAVTATTVYIVPKVPNGSTEESRMSIFGENKE